MSDYAKASGRTRLGAPKVEDYDAPVLGPPPPISAEKLARAKATAQTAREKMPWVVEITKAFVDAGLIHGWRNVKVFPREPQTEAQP